MIDLEPSPIDVFSPGSLWIKRDDRLHPLYGGNKPRKLQRILAEARRQGASRLVTIGAAGSHHVLATVLFGRRAGFAVRAVYTPQPRTPHAVEVLRASMAQGVEPVPLGGLLQIPRALAAFRGAFYIPVGGSSVEGAVAFADAVRELRQAIDRGELPVPEEIVVAAGSGGTAAGLAVGLAREGLPTRLLGVAVAWPPAVIRASVIALAARAAWRLQVPIRGVLARLSVDGSAVGAGYGHPTPAGEAATRVAAERGISLDPTYTSKTFAVALERSKSRRVLYWHTLSSTPMAPLLVGAPEEAALAPELRALLRPVRPGA